MQKIILSSLPFLLFIWTLVGLKFSVHCTAYVHHIEVSRNGHDNTSCLTNFSNPCQTLGYVLKNLKNSTKISISNGNYSLTKNYNISHLENLAFTGENSVVIQCSSGIGLRFRFCYNVVFKRLKFEGCGRLEYSAPFNANAHLYKLYSGVSFTYSKDLIVNNCTFINSNGISLVLNDVGGNVNVSDSYFVNNIAKEYSGRINVNGAGGGVLVHLTQFGSIYPFNDTVHHLYSDNNTYTFRGCVFAQNGHKECNHARESPQPFGNGAGLTFFLCGSAKWNSILIDLCHFHNNTAIWGAGLFAEFHDKAQGNALKIFDSEFKGNCALYGGGGVRTGNDIKENRTVNPMENTVEHKRNRFVNNRAALGGAVSHYGQTYPHSFGENKNSLHFRNCSFHRNAADLGSAISVALNNKNDWIEIGPQIPYCAEITNCTIKNNKVEGMGVVYSSKVPMILRGDNIFHKNYNTSLLLDNAPLKVYNKTSFIGNCGYKGGALALYGQTRLIMTKGSHLFFTSNKAYEKGGALYIRTPGPQLAPFNAGQLRRHACSIGYEDEQGKMVNLDKLQNWDTHISFQNNSASLWGGNSVYATTLQSCFLANESIGENNSAFAWENIFSYSGELKEEISTDPVKIAVHESEWSVAPGEVFKPRIELLDEKNSPVYGIVKINVIGKGYNVSLFPESLFLVQSKRNNLNSTTSVIHAGLKLLGIEKYNFTLNISSVGGQTISISFEQQFKECYDGFEMNYKDSICKCMADNADGHEGVFNCSSDGKHVNLVTGYWGGKVNNKTFVTYPCPQHYCHFNKSNYIFTYDESTICAGNRSGKVALCGKCKNNFTVTLGSETCVQVSKCKGFSIFWGIPLFMVVTPLVILVLLRINVDIFTSYLNSWLYFYQVLPFVLKVETVMKLDKVMQGILKLTSLKLPAVTFTCFVKNLDNIGKLGLNYLLPFYMLFILVIVSLAARCCGCTWYQRTNVFRAISSILVLCYTNLTMISFNVVHWVKLDKHFSVLFIEGSITNQNISAGYYALCVFAILVIICFVIVFPILLLFRPFFIRNVRFMANFTQLYNIFQHCFRDNLGFFSAYYFICRIALLVLTAALSTPGPYKRCFTEILVFVTLVIFVYVQPYKTDSHLKWLNTVDTVILSFLCLMAFMSSSQNTEAAQKTINGMQVCIIILSWLPMIYLAGLVVIAIRYYCPTCIPSRRGYQDLDDPTSTSSNAPRSKPE